MSILLNTDNRVAVSVTSPMPVKQAKALVNMTTGITDDAIEVISDRDTAAEAKIEEPPQFLGRTMLKIHLKYAFFGLLIGMIIAFLLTQVGPEFTKTNANFTYLALISPGMFIGVFLAGFRSLAPGRDKTNLEVMERNQNNQTTLVVRCDDNTDKERVVRAIEQTAGLSAVS